MAYPYSLERNPYPSSPTPTIADAQVLGGKRHRDAKTAIVSCVSELHGKVVEKRSSTERDFRLITVIQDVGSGKTHLALHTKTSREISEMTCAAYADLSQISPRNIQSLFAGMIAGFSEEHLQEIRRAAVKLLLAKADKNIGIAKRVFNYGFFDALRGKSLQDKASFVLAGESEPSYQAISELLSSEYTPGEISVINLIMQRRFNPEGVGTCSTLEDAIDNLATIASVNLKLLGKVTLFQLDEFEPDKESTDFVKAVINAHLPSTVMMLIFTPSSYDALSKANVSVFDRLEKANYKIDLAGSNSVEEVLDIVLEYIRHYDKSGSVFSEDEQRDLAAKIRVIYDEFPDFRNVRSMLNIMYHATENAARRNLTVIDEQAVDDTIKSAYPGLRIRGSVMDVPISDFIRIRRNCVDPQTLESGVRNAVRDLVNYAHEFGLVARPLAAEGKGNGVDVIFSDPYGTKVAVAVVINKEHARSFEQISNTLKSTGFVDKLIILTNANTAGGAGGSTVVNIDRCKMIDLIYFSNKYQNHEMVQDDSERALLLAKSIRLC